MKNPMVTYWGGQKHILKKGRWVPCDEIQWNQFSYKAKKQSHIKRFLSWVAKELKSVL